MRRCCRRGRHGWQGWNGSRLLGVLLLAAGLALLFLCIPGWAWATLLGTLLTAAGLWLATMGF